MTHYGQGNSGPAREVWRDGDRVRLWAGGGWLHGHIATAWVERRAFQTDHVFVSWDDGEGTFENPNNLEPSVAR